MDRNRHRSFARFAISATLGLAACAALAFSCASPVLGKGSTAELSLQFELAADFTSVQAANPGARFLLPEMRSLALEVRSLDPFTAANIDMAIPVSWDPATGWVSGKAVIGVPPDTPLAITVSGLDGSGTAISRAYAEFLVPSDAEPLPLKLVLMPTAAFPSMLELVPDNLSLAQTIPARSSLVCKFLPGSLTGSPAFAAWSFPAAAGLEVSLRLADGTRIPFIPRGDGSGVDFTTPSSLEHYFIVYNPAAGAVNLGSLLAAPAGTLYVPTVSMTDLTKTLGAAPFAIKPSSPSGGAFAFTSSNPAVATIDPVSGLVTMLSTGTSTISASTYTCARRTSSFSMTARRLL